ncbi:MAG: ribbon-helix-helix protein, CopG family [Actinobacteria bacterium]|nr:ribbon-helix-helix protein, CopG family [Actinomycetota bacterium]
MIRTQISMTDEQAAALRRLAAVRERSQAALLRDALDDLVADDERTRRVARARSSIGAFRSAPSATSEDHDAALDDAFGS